MDEIAVENSMLSTDQTRHWNGISLHPAHSFSAASVLIEAHGIE